MEEDALEEALTQYKQQLNQIDDVLKVSNNGDVGELIKLKEDLVELVKTTEESLLCLKKSKLLKLLDQSCEDNTETKIPEHETFEEDENDDEQYETSNQSCSSLAGTPEIENSMAGTQCQAPYVFDWGVKGYYNAMVLSVEEADEDLGGLKVRVLFTNPTHKSMVPCPYFLDGKCRFVDEECRYSHGCVVNMSELRAYKDPDFSLLKVNGKCLAKYEDDVWYKATILSINEGNVSIHYDTYNMDKSVNLEDVLPIDEAEGSDSSDDEDHEPDQYGDDYNDMEDKVIAEFRANSADSCGMLGDWEKHTKGIASKLMAKMGYVVGKGLGKHEDGRVEPVEIILLPTGKSLDACAELREKKKLKEPFKRKKRSVNKTSNDNQVPAQNVFDFINNTLGGKQGSVEDLKQNDHFNTLDRRKSGKPKSHTNYNIELFKLEEEKARIQKQIKKQKDSLFRNSGRDSAVAEQAKHKMTVLSQKFKQLEDKEKLVQRRIHQNNEHKKLTVF